MSSFLGVYIFGITTTKFAKRERVCTKKKVGVKHEKGKGHVEIERGMRFVARILQLANKTQDFCG